MLHLSQYGLRKGRSTIMVMTDLIAQIHEAFSNNMALVSTFFDMEKAYDRVWRHHVLRSLHRKTLRGNLRFLIADFLTNHFIRVRITDCLPNPYTLENGVPQGSVASISLFLISINEITSNVHFPPNQILFTEDVSIQPQTNIPPPLKDSHKIYNHNLDQQTQFQHLK